MNQRIQKNLDIQNDSCEYAVFSKSLCGHKYSTTFESLWEDPIDENPLVQEGVVFYFSQIQDDSPEITVVLGGLTPSERENWVGKLSYNIKIPCGQLVVSGGWDHLAEEDPMDGFLDYAEVPSGNYLLTVYCYDLDLIHFSFDEDEAEEDEDEGTQSKLKDNLFSGFLLHLEPASKHFVNSGLPKWQLKNGKDLGY